MALHARRGALALSLGLLSVLTVACTPVLTNQSQSRASTAPAQQMAYDTGYSYDYEYDYYRDPYYRWVPAGPSSDIVRRALPEGFVQANGDIRGTLCFDRAYWV